MARKINPAEHAVKRKEILAVAQRLVYTKGYEQMSIQELLAELQISKGAFYHYFASKQALLEALIEHMREDGLGILHTILREPGISALAKLQRFFDASARWKTDQKDFIVALMHVWYADDNAIVRQKVQAHLSEHAAPLLSELVREGIAEGVLHTPFPDQASQVVLALLQGVGDALGRLVLAPHSDNAQARAEQLVAAYDHALERVLGLPAGSLSLVDAPTLAEWFAAQLAYEARK